MSEKFYGWLVRKYGWDEETFWEQEEDFREKLVAEYASIAASFS